MIELLDPPKPTRPVRERHPLARRTNYCVSMYAWQVDALQALARETGVAISRMVAEAVLAWLTEHHPDRVPISDKEGST